MAGDAMKLVREWFVFAVLVYACIVFYPARLMLAQGVSAWLLLGAVFIGGAASGIVSVLAIAFFEGRRESGAIDLHR
jgi:hypothetical protein